MHGCNCSYISIFGLTTHEAFEGPMSANSSYSKNLFVANLQSVSLEKLVRSKLEVLFFQHEKETIEIKGLYDAVIEQVEKPLIELALKAYKGNQVKTALMLGINRNTLKKKMHHYKIRAKESSPSKSN